MFKFLTLLYPAEHVSHDDFVAFVESEYLPALAQNFPYVRYGRRNFVDPSAIVVAEHIADIPPPPEYGAILEASIDSGDLARLQRDLRDPAIAARIAALARNKLDEERTSRVAVEEHETPKEKLGSSAKAVDDGSMVQRGVTIRKRADMSYEDFVNYYETRHATMAARSLPMFSKYVRNFVIPDSAIQSSLNPHGPVSRGFDVLTQIWVLDMAAHDAMGEALARPDLAKLFADDEEMLFDRTAIQMLLIDERVSGTPLAH